MSTLHYSAAGEVHAELYVSARTGDMIPVACTCEIGDTHTLAEWTDRYQPAERARTEEVPA